MILNVGIIAEGPTDVMFIKAILAHIIEEDFKISVLQPDLSETEGFGQYGGGWKGVKSWCESIASDYGFYTMLGGTIHYDLFILHIDADVSRESEIMCAKPCPPILDTIESLQEEVFKWLNISTLNKPCLFMLPADNLEAWVLASLVVDDKYDPIECQKKPDRILASSDFRLKKSKKNYQQLIIPTLEDKWDIIKTKCSQAEKFENDILAILR